MHPLEIRVGTGEPAPQVRAHLAQGRMMEPLGPPEVIDPASYSLEVWDIGLDAVTQQEPPQGVDGPSVGLTVTNLPVRGWDATTR